MRIFGHSEKRTKRKYLNVGQLDCGTGKRNIKRNENKNRYLKVMGMIETHFGPYYELLTMRLISLSVQQ